MERRLLRIVLEYRASSDYTSRLVRGDFNVAPRSAELARLDHSFGQWFWASNDEGRFPIWDFPTALKFLEQKYPGVPITVDPLRDGDDPMIYRERTATD